MAPLIVLILGTLVARLIGVFGVTDVSEWSGAIAWGLATMFVFTGVTHFIPRIRRGFVAMVPPQLPRPDLIVAATGVLELMGAVGLMLPATRMLAAWCLVALLIAMFPANIRASRGPRRPGAPYTPLPLRTVLQVIYVGAAVYVALSA